jgi:glycosyltransferase involved in cell wall biosynthesis
MRPPLIIFTPLPPARNGIADYAHELISALQDYYTCICIIADDAPSPKIDGINVNWITVSRYMFDRQRYINMRHLFQMGNNTGHAYMLPWLERLNGITTIHDASLTNLFMTIAAEGRRSKGLRAALGGDITPEIGLVSDAVEAIGGSGLLLGEETNGLDLVALSSRALVVHSHIAASRVLAAAPRAKVEFIPHLVKRATLPKKRDTNNRPFKLLCLGYIARAKKIDLLLRATKILRDSGIDIVLTIAGAPDRLNYDIEADINALDLKTNIHLLGYVTNSEIDELLLDCDMLVNLRSPTTGETSGVLTRAMALGCVCIVTDVGSYAEIPQDCVLKIPLAHMTPGNIAQTINSLINNPRRRNDLSRRAWALSAENEPNKIAMRYSEVIESNYGFMNRMSPLALESSGLWFLRSVVTSQPIMPIWHVAGLLPLARTGSRLRLMGGEQTDAGAAQSLGWILSLHDETDTDSFDAYLILCPPHEDAESEIDEWVKMTISNLASGGLVVIAGPISGNQLDNLKKYFLERGLQIVKKATIDDLAALKSIHVVPAEWKGLVFAPTTMGIGWFTT